MCHSLTTPVVLKPNFMSESISRLCYCINISENEFQKSLFLINAPSNSEAPSLIPDCRLAFENP